MLGVAFGQIGKVIENKNLVIKDSLGKTVVDIAIDNLKNAWQKPLKW
jgi:hypothetical protein